MAWPILSWVGLFIFQGSSEEVTRRRWLSGASWGSEASLLTTAVLATGIGWLVWKGALKSDMTSGRGYPVEAASV